MAIPNGIVQYSVVAKKSKRGDKRPEIKAVSVLSVVVVLFA